MKLYISSLKSIRKTAQEFIAYTKGETIFLINGNMGAGKTTFIKAICKELGIVETVNSPTFSIINEYKTIKGEIIYHFDCYRINRIEEALEIGIEEYLYSGNRCFIEWSENIAPLLPDSFIQAEIKEDKDGTRIVEIDI